MEKSTQFNLLLGSINLDLSVNNNFNYIIGGQKC